MRFWNPEKWVAWQHWKKRHTKPFDFIDAVYKSIILVNAGLGIAILVGGTERFPFPTYKPLLDLTNGSVNPWGIAILASAALMSWGGNWTNLVGLGLGLLWMDLFCAMFFIAYKYDTSGSTAPIPYLGFALIIVALMTCKVIELKDEHDDHKGG